MAFRGIQAETVKFEGFNGDSGEAYYAHPLATGRYSGVVVIHHFPGWDEWTTEVARKFAHHGYAAIAPASISVSVTALHKKWLLALAQPVGRRMTR